jgi:hypothetical protein
MAARTAWEERAPTRGQWLLSLGLSVVGGLAWFIAGFGVAAGGLVAVLFGILPALTCLVAGWLLRSWWGLVATAVVYIAVSAVMWVLAVGGGPDGMAFLTVTFALYVVLPGVALSAIGTAIGRDTARRAG